MDINNFPIPSATVSSQAAQILSDLGISATPVRDHLYGPGNTTPHNLSISSGEVSPNVTTHGHSQNLGLTATVSSFNVPTGLDDCKTLFVQIYKSSVVPTFSLHASIRLMGGTTAADFDNMSANKFAWLTITRADTAYLATITLEQ